MSAPNDWPFFQQNLNDEDSSSYVPSNMSEYSMFRGRISSAPTTTVTTVAAASGQTGSSSSAVSGGGSHLKPEGRVSKPSRRRSRASRQTPTTLFNTDTANFRAMVQQFTGGPSSPFTMAGGAARQANLNPGPAVMLPARGGSGYQSQYQPAAQSQAYAFAMGDGIGNPGDVSLVQSLSGGGRGANTRDDMVGFLGDEVSPQVPTSRTSSDGANENRGNVFMY